MSETKTKIVITADDRTRSGLDSAQRRLRSVGAEAAKLSSILAGLGVGVSLGGLAAMVKSTADTADQMGKLAQQTGVAIEDLSRLRHAAEMSGSNLQTLTGTLRRLNQNLAEVATTGKGAAAEAFNALRISVKNADGSLKTGNEIISEVADRFGKMEDGARKTALAIDIFGKSGAELIPMLNSGAAGLEAMKREADDLGIVISENTFRAAEAFNDNLARMKKVQQGIITQVSAELLPTMLMLSQEMLDVSRNTNLVSSAAAAAKTFLETLVIVGGNVAFVFRGVGTEIGGIAAQLNALARGDFSGVARIGQMMREDAAQARADLNAWEQRILNPAPTDMAALKADADARIESARRVALAEAAAQDEARRQAVAAANAERARKRAADEAARAQKKAADDALRAYERLMDEGRRITESVRTPTEILGAEIVRLNDYLNAGAIDWETYSRAVERAQDAYESTLDSTRKLRAEQEQLAALMSATPTAQLERMRSDMLLLRDAFAAGKISAEQFVEAAQTRLGTLPDTIKKTTDAMTVFAEQAGRNIQDAFAQFLFDPFEGGLKGMLQSWGKMLQRMIAEAVAADLANRIGAWGKGASGAGGALGAIAGIAGSIFGGPRASGGPVQAGKTYLVGERGPELVRMGGSGHVVPNHKLGGQTINLTVNVASGTPQEVRRAAGAGAREALGAFAMAQRYA